ncbi:hypothetical protein ACFWA9_10025 [Kitasatospora sp. NPDC059973]|uniref:hypothetical protein n=1 Tax=Kitasatospora sp. NPDC059973 TaxID=3347020 RepID=UPI003688F97D
MAQSGERGLGGESPTGAEALLVALDLYAGELRAYATGDFAQQAPALVGACWGMRWPIPNMEPAGISSLLHSIVPHAENLIRRSRIREKDLGVILEDGA